MQKYNGDVNNILKNALNSQDFDADYSDFEENKRSQLGCTVCYSLIDMEVRMCPQCSALFCDKCIG